MITSFSLSRKWIVEFDMWCIRRRKWVGCARRVRCSNRYHLICCLIVRFERLLVIVFGALLFLVSEGLAEVIGTVISILWSLWQDPLIRSRCDIWVDYGGSRRVATLQIVVLLMMTWLLVSWKDSNTSCDELTLNLSMMFVSVGTTTLLTIEMWDVEPHCSV